MSRHVDTRFLHLLWLRAPMLKHGALFASLGSSGSCVAVSFARTKLLKQLLDLYSFFACLHAFFAVHSFEFWWRSGFADFWRHSWFWPELSAEHGWRWTA